MGVEAGVEVGAQAEAQAQEAQPEETGRINIIYWEGLRRWIARVRYTQHMRALTAAQEDQQQAGRAAGGEGGPHNEQQQLVGEGAGHPFVRAAHHARSQTAYTRA